MEASAAVGPWWERVRPLGFAMPRCTQCGRFHFYPRPRCPFCGGTELPPTAASGLGTVFSVSVVHRAPHPSFAADVPYAVVIVQTDEGPHLMSRVVGIPPEAVRIGLRVRVKAGGEGAPPVFEPMAEGAP